MERFYVDVLGFGVTERLAMRAWGHKPTLRLQLTLAGGLVSRRFSST